MPAGGCARCGIRRRWLHKHHIKFRCDGGTDADGIELICANCHEDVHEGPMGGKSVYHRRFSPEANAKRAAGTRRRYENPEERRKQSEKQQAYWREHHADFDSQVRALREAQMSMDRIAAELGASRQRVYRSLKRAGDPSDRATMQHLRRERERLAREKAAGND